MEADTTRRSVLRDLAGIFVGSIIGNEVANAAVSSEGAMREGVAATAAATGTIVFNRCLEVAKSWIDDIAAVEQTLAQVPGVDVQALAETPEFQNVVLRATRIALADIDSARRRLLLNAIRNSALQKTPTLSEGAMLMRLVDDLTPFHVRLLAVVLGPQDWCSKNRIAIPTPTPPLRGWIDHCLRGEFRGAMLTQAWEDLWNSGLIRGPRDALEHQYWNGQEVRPWGMSLQLLQFISEPEAANQSSTST